MQQVLFDGPVGPTLRQFAERHAETLEEVTIDQDGAWAYTRKGWANPDDVALHTYHEDNATQLIQFIKAMLPVPCDCERCTT